MVGRIQGAARAGIDGCKGRGGGAFAQGVRRGGGSSRSLGDDRGRHGKAGPRHQAPLGRRLWLRDVVRRRRSRSSNSPTKPTLAEADRLPEYRASKVPRIVHRLTADDPYYKDLEIARLAGYWQEAIDLSSARTILLSSACSATRRRWPPRPKCIEGSQLDRVAERRKLLDGGKAAVAGVDRSADRARPRRLPDAPPAGEELRSRGRDADAASRRRTGEDPLQAVRQGSLSRRHVLVALELRQGCRLRRGRHADAVPDQLCRTVRAQFRVRRQAAVRFAADAGWKSNAISIWPRLSTLFRRSTSSAAIPVRRWSIATANSWD